jgi:TraM recognition site of TraD and TraG
VGPLLNKLRSFLLRRTVRNILGQSQSTVSIQEAVDHQCILLVSLSKGLLGEETSQLMGSFLVARIWQAALARASRPEQWRPDFNLYLDEFQNYLHLPQNLDDVLVEARGYHLSLVLANQHLGQLQPTTREALSANARTRVAFQCGQEDARYLAREFQPGLDERDLRNLQRFQVAVRLCVGGRTEPPFTGMTVAAPPSLGDLSADRLVEKSVERWGRPRAKVEAEIVQRLRANGLLAAADEALGA